MKKATVKVVLSLVLGALTLWGCKDDEEEAAPKASNNEDYKIYTQILSGFNGIGKNVDQAYSDTTNTSNGRLSSACASFAFHTNTTGNAIPGFGTNYNKIVLDYTGAQCSDGISRSGQIVIYFSGWLTSWKDSVVLNNFNTNGLVINGYRSSRYNPSLSTSAVSAYDVRVEGDVTNTSGTFHWSSTEVWKNTGFFTDAAQIAVSGSGLVDNKQGYVIYGNVTSPLIYKGNCSPAFRYAVQGNIEFTSNTDKGVKTSVNYGNGTCDNNAVFTDTFGNNYTFLQ